MSQMKVSDLFSNNRIKPFILGSFFSRYIFSEDKSEIYTEISFKSSRYEKFSLDDYKDEYINTLNEVCSPYSNWEITTSGSSFKAKFSLINDLNLNEDNFFNKLYTDIISKEDWFINDEMNEYKKDFIRGFVEPRGSIDTTMKLIAQDYFYNSIFETKKARLLVDYFCIPYYLLNLNFRDLQNQFITGENQRNTQLRLNAFWYMSNIGMYNKYKAGIFEIAYNQTDFYEENNVIYFKCDWPSNSSTNIFDERLNYYSTNIYGKEITEEEATEFRVALGFDGKKKTIRNIALVELIRYNTPDECVCCKDKYNIKDRTFTHRKTGKPYFEIHHAISLGSNIELDDEDNLVKVCPVCHGCLKKGIGTEKEQKELIIELLKHSPQVLEFAKHIFDTNDYDLIIQKIYENLK